MEYRHRIHEFFSERRLEALNAVRTSGSYTNNNDKVDAMLDIMKDMPIAVIGPGTNRLTVLIEDYVYKIAMDSYGVQDNWTEFRMSPLVQPYVTKTYECNGLIAVAEYVNLITKEEFVDSKEVIRGMLDILKEDYLFCDISLTPKNYLNYGYRDNGNIVILDFGYLYPIDLKIMHCRRCGALLDWDSNYVKLVCTNPKCKKPHDPIEIRDRMRKKETDFHVYDNIPEGILKINVEV